MAEWGSLWRCQRSLLLACSLPSDTRAEANWAAEWHCFCPSVQGPGPTHSCSGLLNH